MEPYDSFVHLRLTLGVTPNDLVERIHDALVRQATDWVYWGDGRWRLDTVCSMCGSESPGVCLHMDDPNRRVIVRREYEALKGEA